MEPRDREPVTPTYAYPPALARIAELAAEHDLGTHRQVFPKPATGIGCIYLVVVPFALLSTALFIVALVAGAVPGAVVAGIFMTLFWAIVVWLYGENAKKKPEEAVHRLDLYERGFVATWSGKPRVIRYDTTVVHQEITRYMWYGVMETARSHVYRFIDVDRRKFRMEGYPNPEVWGPAIQRSITDAQLPAATTALRSGQTLRFGPLWMTVTAVGKGNRSVPWSDITSLEVRDGKLLLGVAGRFLSQTTPVSEISNFYQFVGLAERLKQQNSPPTG